MNLLLDTQTLVYWLKDERLSPKARRTILNPRTNVWVSIVAPWEFILKPQLLKTGVTLDRLWQTLGELRAELLPIRKEHIQQVASLQWHPEHRDPFDRMLVAQAIAENLTIVGGDTRFKLYRELKVLW